MSGLGQATCLLQSAEKTNERASLAIQWSGLCTPKAGGLSLTPGWRTKILHATCAKSLQSRLTLRNPMDGSPPGSSVHGISQGSILECVAISFSRGSSLHMPRGVVNK